MEHPVNMNMGRPKIAIVDANTLVVLGLKQLLQNVMPIMTVDSFSSFQEFEKAQPNSYYHYFVSQVIVLETILLSMYPQDHCSDYYQGPKCTAFWFP